jgi:hypothetical protein
MDGRTDENIYKTKLEKMTEVGVEQPDHGPKTPTIPKITITLTLEQVRSITNQLINQAF